MKKIILAIAAGMTVLTAPAADYNPQPQKADCGKIQRIEIYSPQMADTMVVDVWLPEDYDESGEKRYPVIYMHDGQNLYDASTTWNRQSWEVDSVMCALLSSGEVEPAIIVGVHSFQQTRVADLMPQKAVAGAGLDETLDSVKLKGRAVRGDAYAAFLTQTLKPAIDAFFPTNGDRAHTTVAGSSMGGLMSIYALCEYPEVFGNALCLSTHWIGAPEVSDRFSRAMYDYIYNKVPTPTTHKLYFDHGTATLDAFYGTSEMKILEMLRKKGYGEERMMNKVALGAAHEENAWKLRIGDAFKFVLGKD